MKDIGISEAERKRFARARQRGEHAARSDRAVIEVHYDELRDTIELLLRNERRVSIARADIPGLRRVAAAALTDPVVSIEGDAISWRAIDVDIDVTRFIAASTSALNPPSE
jgi:hypothetical protein